MKKKASPYLGRRLLTENLQDGRAAYGGRILATVSRELMMAELFGTSQQNVSLHLQNIVRARLDGQVGYGVLEQFVLGEHAPSGMKGFTDGWAAGLG